MTEVKLTKMELRDRQYRLNQLEKYLPTLQLKKVLLQNEVNQALYEIKGLTNAYLEELKECAEFQALFTDPEGALVREGAIIERVEKRFENVAGSEIPFFEKVIFRPVAYSLLTTPLWIDVAIARIQNLVIAKEKISVAKEKKEILEKELREISIRVNLFEKILIPRTQGEIKKIKLFLEDQELASISQAKVAKNKINKRNLEQEAFM